MSAVLFCVLMSASWLALAPRGSLARRARTALPPDPARRAPGPAAPFRGRRLLGRVLSGRAHGKAPYVPMTVVVQQMAALLNGGRAPARLWDELWLLYAGDTAPDARFEQLQGPALAPATLAFLAAARAAALRGSSVAHAIRSAEAIRGTGADTAADAFEQGVWAQLAACFDVAEASGCPLADVLARFAAQLEAEDDAEAARQTALAGPRATVRLLGWLPLLGLGLGVLLGVDPVKVLLATPYGIAAFAMGVMLTAAGRIWSDRLVRAAAGLQ